MTCRTKRTIFTWFLNKYKFLKPILFRDFYLSLNITFLERQMIGRQMLHAYFPFLYLYVYKVIPFCQGKILQHTRNSPTKTNREEVDSESEKIGFSN